MLKLFDTFPIYYVQAKNLGGNMADNRSPIELLKDAKKALDLLAPNGALFGRGNQIDILKAQELIAEVVRGQEAEQKAFEVWELSHGFRK
jgi:hypothetical protein